MSNDSLYSFFGRSEKITFLSAGSAHFSNVRYGQWNPECYLSELGRMKFLQYGTGCAGKCLEVTESTVPYVLKEEALQYGRQCTPLIENYQTSSGTNSAKGGQFVQLVKT